MTSDDFFSLAKKAVRDYFNSHVDKTQSICDSITEEEVYIVWSCKTLQNNKALLSTPVPDGLYYEVTYNGDNHEMYLDVYKKWENVCIGVEV